MHAPADTFLAWHFRRHQCGAVVDKLDLSELSRELGRLLSDERLRDSLAENARRRAPNFSAVRAHRLFAETVKLGAGGESALAGAAR